MSNVTPFPARRGPLGDVVELSEFRAGLSNAGAVGIDRADLQAVLNQDRPLATYALKLLGSQDQADCRRGKLMLTRMVGTLSDPTDEPPSAA